MNKIMAYVATATLFMQQYKYNKHKYCIYIKVWLWCLFAAYYLNYLLFVCCQEFR